MRLSKLVLLIAFLVPVQALAVGVPMNTVAVHPTNRNEMFAASDSAGLFRSTNGGLNWQHVVSLPVSLLQAVAYLPADPGIVLVSAKADPITGNGGGIWRSLDGGGSWDPAPLEPEFAGLSAYEISAVGETVVVGTSEGVFLTINGGEDWGFASPFAFGDRTVYSVLVTPGQPSRIYAGGPSGVRIATTAALDQWTMPGGGVGGVYSIHAFGRSALSVNHAFAVVGHLLFRTENGGATWSVITSAPIAQPCAGIPFIKTMLRSKGFVPQFLHLYYGNGCGLHHLAARVFPAVDYSGPWQQVNVGPFSPRDLALFQGVPALLASNAGLHITADGGVTWTLVPLS